MVLRIKKILRMFRLMLMLLPPVSAPIITTMVATTVVSCESKSQSLLNGSEPTRATMLYLGGESNTGGGYGQNSLANAREAEISTCKIMDTVYLRYALMKKGYNLFGTYDTTHSFELTIARNGIDSGLLGRTNGFFLKTAIGSTVVAQWMPGQTFYINMILRMDSARSKLQREVAASGFREWMLWSQGLNNAHPSVNTPAAQWKDSTKVIFAALKARYPNLKIILTHFNQSSYPTLVLAQYNTAIDEIAAELDYAWAVDVTGATLVDLSHWDYDGLKLIGRRMMDIIVAND